SFTAQSTEYQGGYIRATEGSVSGEAVINVDNEDDPPWIDGVIPNQLKPEDFGSWTLDLTGYANDSEDSLSLLRWHIDGDNSSLYTVTGDDKPGNHVLTFTTVRDAFGNDEITLSLIDRFDQSAQQSLWVNITPVNDGPTIRAPLKVYLRYDVPRTIDYAPYIEDVDNSAQDLILTTDDPLHATVQGLKVTYEYPESMVDESIFVVLTVSDGIDENLDVVQVIVSGNFPPRLMDQIADIIMDEDEQLLNEFDLDDYFEDPDDDVLIFGSISDRIGISIDSNGLVSLTPEQNWFGEELVVFTATDSAGAVAQDAALVTVLPVNDPPVIGGLPDIVIRYNETFDFDVTPYISDVDDPISDLTISCSDTDNTRILGKTISFFYPSETELNVTVTVKDKKNANASDVMGVRVTDNRPPVSKGLPNVVMYEDTSLLLAFDLDEYFYDPDGGNLTYTFHQTLYYVEVELNAANWVDFTPAADWSGQEVIVFRAMDDENAIVEDTVVVTVLPVNDAPVFLPVPKQVGKINKPWLLDLSLYVYDPDNTTEDLTFLLDSEYVTVVGHYAIFICNESFSLQIADATVSDGLLQDSQQIEISISSLVSPEVNVFIWPASIGIVLLALFGLTYWRAIRRYAMEDLFLVGREGKLIVHKTKRARPDRDEDILAGMLTAVQEFAKDVFREEKESLKAFELQQKRIVIETARNFYVAAIFAGKEPKRASKSLEAFVEDVDVRYGSMIKSWSGDMGELEDLPEMVDYFVNVRKYEVGDWKED
ncbi:MAG: Ig-like domain-containing protein, partial [Thermoplasmata archaeon]